MENRKVNPSKDFRIVWSSVDHTLHSPKLQKKMWLEC